VKSMIMERRPLPLIAAAMDVLTSCYAQASRPSSGANYQPTQFTKGSIPTATGGITLSAGPRVVVPASLTASPGMQQAALQSPPESGGNDTGKTEIADSDIEEESAEGAPDFISDQELITNSEIEEAPSTSSQTQYSAESSGRALSREGSTNIAMEASTSNIPSLSGLQGLRMGLSAPFISPEDMQQSVFLAIEEEMAVDSTFLVAAIVEYMRSTSKEHVRIPPGLQVLVVQLLGREEKYDELRQFIAGKVIEPSRAVAVQLLEVGSNHAQTRKLGMEMLRLLHAHSDYVKLLLQDGRLLEGLRYIRQNKVDAIPPAMFLEAAANVNDAQKLASVFRFCLDFVPGFQQSPDFKLYSSHLNQQCTVGNGDS